MGRSQSGFDDEATPASTKPMQHLSSITSLIAVAVLLGGINLAAAQALPTNPPTPMEGGALPPN